MSNSKLVSVVIINFNSGKYIFDCIRALESQSYNAVEIVVVDNFSSDGSSELLGNYISCIPFKYYLLEKNMGASYANNYGIHKASGQFLLVLNADVFLDKLFIEKCILAFEKQRKIGTVVGKLLSAKDPLIIDSVGVKIYSEGFGKDLGYGERDFGQYDTESYVDGACCAAAVYKRDMLEDIRFGDEYFDEDYFAFYEDLDLSYRASLMGWVTLYIPEAKGRHVRGGSTQAVTSFVKYLASRNIILFLIKSYKPQTLKARFNCYLYIFIKLMFINKLRLLIDYYRLRNKIKVKKAFLKSRANFKIYYNDSYIWERVKKITAEK